jgi:hypothetical protein
MSRHLVVRQATTVFTLFVAVMLGSAATVHGDFIHAR